MLRKLVNKVAGGMASGGTRSRGARGGRGGMSGGSRGGPGGIGGQVGKMVNKFVGRRR